MTNNPPLEMSIDDWTRCLGQAFQVIRISVSMTQSELAHAMSEVLSAQSEKQHCIVQSYVSKIESDDPSISLERLFAFCKAVNCRPSELFEQAERIFVLSTNASARQSVYEKMARLPHSDDKDCDDEVPPEVPKKATARVAAKKARPDASGRSKHKAPEMSDCRKKELATSAK